MVKRRLAWLFSGSALSPAGGQLAELLANLDRHLFERFAYLPAPGPLAQRLMSSGVEVGFAPGLAPRTGIDAAMRSAARWLLSRRFDLVQAEGLRPAAVSTLRRALRPGRLVWVFRHPPLGAPEARLVRRLHWLPDRIVLAGSVRAEDFPPHWGRSMVRIEDAVEAGDPGAGLDQDRHAAELLSNREEDDHSHNNLGVDHAKHLGMCIGVTRGMRRDRSHGAQGSPGVTSRATRRSN